MHQVPVIMNKPQANLIIAKALGYHDPYEAIADESVNNVVRYDKHHFGMEYPTHYDFNIFINPSDCQAAVIHLGEKHYKAPRPYGFGWTCKMGIVEEHDVSKTYQEAVATAYIALEGS